MGRALSFSSLLLIIYLCLAQGCNDGWTGFQGSCYLYIPDLATCNTLRAKLVEIETDAENNFVSNMLAAHSVVYAWIGLEDFAMEGRFVWASTQEPPEYTHWQAGEPNNYGRGEDCVMIKNSSKEWIDEDCERDHYSFICEIQPETNIIG